MKTSSYDRWVKIAAEGTVSGILIFLVVSVRLKFGLEPAFWLAVVLLFSKP